MIIAKKSFVGNNPQEKIKNTRVSKSTIVCDGNKLFVVQISIILLLAVIITVFYSNYSRAYNLLKVMCSERGLVGDNFIANLTKTIELSAYQKNVILSQVQAVYGHQVKSISINASDAQSFEVEKTRSKSPQNNQIANYSNAELLVGIHSPTILSRVRARLVDYLGANGQDLDRRWFSKVEANIDNDSNTLKLKASSSFVKDWITESYSHLLERFCYQEKYSVVFI